MEGHAEGCSGEKRPSPAFSLSNFLMVNEQLPRQAWDKSKGKLTRRAFHGDSHRATSSICALTLRREPSLC